MNAVKKKLKSQRGASAVIALMFFVVASAVGAIVLSSASANAGRATHALSDQQEYYAVESALKLITDDFASGEMRFPAEENAEPSGDAAQKHILKIEDFVFSETQDHKIEKSVSISSNDCPGMPEVTGTLTLQYTKQKDDDSNLYSFLTNSTTTKKKVDALKLSDNLKLVLDIGVQIDPENEDLQSNRVRITYLPIVTTKNVYTKKVSENGTETGDVESKLVTTISWYQQKMEKGVSAANG